MTNVITFISAYLIALNLIGFLLMGIDKYKAKKRGFRIPEATLFIVALIGGSLGSIVGMYLFHHKTRHLSFVYGMPVILFIQIVLIIAILYAPIDIAII